MNLKQDIWPLLAETWDEFQKDEAGQCGAALAYYTMFSIFPLLLLLLAGLGFVLRYWDSAINVQDTVLSVFSQHFSRQFGDTLREIVGNIKNQAGSATGIGFVTLLIGASGVFLQLDTSFKKIWKVDGPQQNVSWIAFGVSLVRDRLFSFGMMLVLGLLLIVSLALTGVTQALIGGLSHLPLIGGGLGYLAGLFVTVLLNAFIFALLFKYLPGTKIQWRDVALGAAVTAVMWELAKHLLALYIAHNNYVNAYGTVGTVLVLMAWIFFSSQVVFLGAEFTEVYSRRHGSRSQQTPVQQPIGEPKQASGFTPQQSLH